MPRESRKITSKNKRRMDRNVALSSIREMLHRSTSSKRYSPFLRDTRRKCSPGSKNHTYNITESSVFTLTPQQSPLPNSPPTPVSAHENPEISLKKSQDFEPQIPQVTTTTVEKTLSEESAAQLDYKKLVQSGIHYIMLPIHLLQFCLWGNNRGAILSTSEFKKYVSDAETSSDVVPIPQETLSSSPSQVGTPSTITTASIKSDRLPATADASPPTTAPQSEDPLDLSGDEESSDEMVTANEFNDDSSSDQWSSASSTRPSMNMSIDFANNNNFEKYANMNVMEEPMEVTLDESVNMKQVKSSPRARDAVKFMIERQRKVHSSGSSSECTWSDGVSSIDREIAGIFARACTSSSSSDEESYYRKPGTPVIRRRRPSNQSPKTPSKNKPRSLRKKDSPLVKLGGKKIRREKLPSLTDSAYSDEDNRMSFHESYPPGLRIPELMDQDIDYGADTEDSNDGIPSLRPRALSYEADTDSTSYKAPQFAQKTVCSCGSPACYPVPIGVLPLLQPPARSWALSAGYPPAPTPLPHLYYQYPEFMSQPISQLNTYNQNALNI